jgi:1-acyl-sn-glycerol-3-phosphate acyltransferase
VTPADRASTAYEGGAAVLRRYSPWLVALFVRWLGRYLRRSFDGVRTVRSAVPSRDVRGPLLVVSNHPSWWDPLHFLVLARWALPHRRLFGPFDAAMLDRYRFFARIGGFGVEQGTRRGASQFLETSRAVLAAPDAMLWVTAQGDFSDPRDRPLELRPGVSHLVRRLEDGIVLPLAVEYPFWNERLPEALSRFGRPIEIAVEPARDTSQWTSFLADRLTETMDALAEDAASRDPDRFETVVLGRAGVGGIYDRWRSVRARLAGQPFDPAHQRGRR